VVAKPAAILGSFQARGSFSPHQDLTSTQASAYHKQLNHVYFTPHAFPLTHSLQAQTQVSFVVAGGTAAAQTCSGIVPKESNIYKEHNAMDAGTR